MGRRLRVFAFLLLVGVCSSLNPRTGLEGSNSQQQELEGAIDIRIQPAEGTLIPPAELLLVDPQGRKSGRHTRTEQVFSEIPHTARMRWKVWPTP